MVPTTTTAYTILHIKSHYDFKLFSIHNRNKYTKVKIILALLHVRYTSESSL